MALVLDEGKLRLIVRRWSVFGVPLPLWLAPRGDAYEHAADGRFHFHVEIAHPFTGLIAGYRGWLDPGVIALAVAMRNKRTATRESQP